MRILLLAEGNPETRGSWSGSTLGLLGALRALGHDVAGRDVAEPRWARWLGLAAAWAPSRATWKARYHFGPIGFRARTAVARKAVTELAPDAVLQIGATFDGLSTARVPAFLYCDSNVAMTARHPPYGEVPALTRREIREMRAREAAVYAQATAVFTMSEYLRRSFISDFGLPEKGVITVYAGANLDPLPRPPSVRDRSAPPTILFVGRHWERKGGPILLEAFRQVHAARPDVKLRIAGCTPPVGREPGIELLGQVARTALGAEARLSVLYESADLFCMPSRFEPFGIVFVEAMLHGVPCIGSDRCAMPEIITAGETGWIIPDGDCAALRDCLLAALADRDRLAVMGAQARACALQLFTWERVAQRILNAIEPTACPVEGGEAS